MAHVLKKLWSDERGLETVEYAIVAGLIVVGVITAITAIGVWVGNKWSTFRSSLGA
jgi:Flp pilus assembly pilin Flp